MLEPMLPPASDHADRAEVSDLSDEERAALVSAATWYAHYHARIIAERADDRSASAKVERERFHALVHGLRKLGIRLPPPEILAEPLDRAA